MDRYGRSRSQSRFPPIDEHPGGFPTGQPLTANQRSKSLDNRKEFEHGADDDFSYDRSLERNSTLHASIPRRQQQRGGDFFNETITTIPTHLSNRSSSKQYLNQRDEAADDDWTSYDKKVKYQHERTIYPQQPRHDRYYEDRYNYRSPPPAYPPQGLSPRSVASRYPDSEYYQRNQRMQQQQHRPLDYSRSADAQSGYHRETVERSARGGDYRYFDEESANVAPAHRAAASAAEATRSSAVATGGGGGGGHRSYHYQYESHGGTGGRHGHANGGYVREKRSGGFWGSGRQQQEPRVYHKIHCCCFSFKWPPFSYEECEPPRPMYPKSPKPVNPPPPQQY